MLRHARVLSYVDEVARQGSFRAAAARLNVAASAVQRRIADIETDLGVPIFERSKTGMRLTAAGEAFLAWVRKQAADLDRVRSHIQDLQGVQTGIIRVACSQAIAAGMLPTEIAAFRTRYPNVEFQVAVQSHAQAYAALAAYEVDLVLVFRPAAADTVSVLATLRQRLWAVMAAGHTLTRQASVRLRDCAPYPAALLDRSFGSRQIMDDVLAARSIRFRAALESNSFELLRRFVAATDAISFQIEAGMIAEPGLAIRPVDDRDGCHGALVLAKAAGRGLPVAADVFARHLAGRMDAMSVD